MDPTPRCLCYNTSEVFRFMVVEDAQSASCTHPLDLDILALNLHIEAFTLAKAPHVVEVKAAARSSAAAPAGQFGVLPLAQRALAGVRHAATLSGSVDTRATVEDS